MQTELRYSCLHSEESKVLLQEENVSLKKKKRKKVFESFVIVVPSPLSYCWQSFTPVYDITQKTKIEK